MPDVRVSYDPQVQIDHSAVADVLTAAIVEELSGNLEHPLKPAEIDIEFRERGPHDRPIANITVRVTAHATYPRLHDQDGIANRIRLALEPVTWGLTVDVGLRLPSVGYSSVDYDATRALGTGGLTLFSSASGGALMPPY